MRKLVAELFVALDGYAFSKAGGYFGEKAQSVL
jgi:hypothetical protein